MRYFGGKAKIAKELSIFLNSKIQPNQTFIDLFCGSCNVVSKIQAKERIANDLHKELIALHIAVQEGQELPSAVSESEYLHIKQNKELYPDWLVAFVGFGLSFSGKYFGGYARDNRGDDYCGNAKSSLNKKHSRLEDVKFINLNYSDVQIPQESFIYCDIPYKDTTKYSVGDFKHDDFYRYAKQKQSEGYIVYVSEYEHNVPEDWKVVWRHESTKSIRNKDKVQEATVEVVMTPS
jgi:DNA adenine methylase